MEVRAIPRFPNRARIDLPGFEQLVRENQRRVLTIAYQICGSLEDARDIAQEAFLRAFRYRHRFRPEGRFSAWLNRITVHAAIDFLRRRPAPAGTVPFDEARAWMEENRRGGGEPSAEERIAVRESSERLFALLDRLAPRERAAFVLRDLEGLSTLEVARSMGCTRITVRRHSGRAREKLRRALRAVERAPAAVTPPGLDPALARGVAGTGAKKKSSWG